MLRGMGGPAFDRPDTMRLTVNALRTCARRLAGLLLFVAPATACAADGASFRLVELDGEQRMVVLMRVSDQAEGTVHVPVLRTALVHGIFAELVDAEGRRLSAPFVLQVFGAARAVADAEMPSALLRLSADHPGLILPRQYGVPIEAGDSLRLSAQLPEGIDVELRITLEYELPGQASQRMPVRAVAATAAIVRPVARVTETEAEWVLYPDADGRLLAIAGRQVIGAEEMVLQDVATGEELWRERLNNGGSRSAAQRRTIARPAVLVEKGRTYRLRVRFATVEQRTAMDGDDAPLALLLPDDR